MPELLKKLIFVLVVLTYALILIIFFRRRGLDFATIRTMLLKSFIPLFIFSLLSWFYLIPNAISVNPSFALFQRFSIEYILFLVLLSLNITFVWKLK